MATAEVLPPTSWEGFKKQADAAFNKGQYTQAVDYYGQAIDTACNNNTEHSACAKLYANRALSYQRAGTQMTSTLFCQGLPSRVPELDRKSCTHQIDCGCWIWSFSCESSRCSCCSCDLGHTAIYWNVRRPMDGLHRRWHEIDHNGSGICQRCTQSLTLS